MLVMRVIMSRRHVPLRRWSRVFPRDLLLITSTPQRPLHSMFKDSHCTTSCVPCGHHGPYLPYHEASTKQGGEKGSNSTKPCSIINSSPVPQCATGLKLTQRGHYFTLVSMSLASSYRTIMCKPPRLSAPDVPMSVCKHAAHANQASFEAPSRSPTFKSSSVTPLGDSGSRVAKQEYS